MAFEIIPAIDLRGGRCVRLLRGAYEQETVYADDPAEVAAQWSAAGVRTLHVVDLDGAAQGRPANLEALRRIRAVSSVAIQYGGGLRNDAAVEEALEAGADALVLGTALVTRPDWVADLWKRYGDRVVVGLDVRDGQVATEGWLRRSSLATDAAVLRANAIGVRRGLFTDIARDGTLGGPNLSALRRVVEAAAFEVIASGGVASLEDVEAIRSTGAGAVIVGRALYTGAIDLHAAMARLSER